MPKPIVPIAIAVSLAFAGTAQAKYVLKHGHCRVHYVKLVERVKVRGHGRIVKVCVKRKAPARPPVAPVPNPPAPAPVPTPAASPPPPPAEPKPPTVGSLGINSSKGGSEGDVILTPHITSGGQPVPITCIGAERNISLSFYGHEIIDYVRVSCEYLLSWASPEAGQFAFWQGEYNYAHEHELGHIWRFTTREEVEHGEVLVDVTYNGGPSYAASTTLVPLVFMP